MIIKKLGMSLVMTLFVTATGLYGQKMIEVIMNGESRLVEVHPDSSLLDLKIKVEAVKFYGIDVAIKQTKKFYQEENEDSHFCPDTSWLYLPADSLRREQYWIE